MNDWELWVSPDGEVLTASAMWAERSIEERSRMRTAIFISLIATIAVAATWGTWWPAALFAVVAAERGLAARTYFWRHDLYRARAALASMSEE